MKQVLGLLVSVLLLACNQASVNTTAKSSSDSDQKELSFMEKMEQEALKEPFKGLATSQGMETGLFPVKMTGVSTENVIKAGQAFLASLSEEELIKTQFEIDDDEWRRWSNVDNGIFPRQGISIKEMTQAQRKLAFDLLTQSLSAKGLQLSKDIMKTDQTLRELNNDDPAFDEDLYFFTLMGTPSDTEPWGWQIDGHHLVVNYFVLGDQVVMTPVFMGGEPIITTTGKYKGNTIFQDEQNLGLKFMQSLPIDFQAEATLSKDKTRHSAKTEAFKDNEVIDYEGLAVSKLEEVQKQELLKLVHQYISNMREGHAEIKMEEVEEHIDKTWFAWIGDTTDDAVFYYRIHSPVVLIEFDHQGAVGVKAPRGSGATRNHIHTVVRTPNGNDYGKDLLKQHLEKHH